MEGWEPGVYLPMEASELAFARAKSWSCAFLLFSLRYIEESSSEMPPDRNVTPGIAGGRHRSKVRTVVLAIVAGSDLSAASTPGTVMEGFNRDPSRSTPLSCNFAYTVVRTRS